VTFGQFGVVGFLAEFGLLALSVFRATSALKYVRSERDQAFLAGLALIVAINLIELLPNSTLTPWTWLLAGALLARAESCRAPSQRKDLKELAPSAGTRYLIAPNERSRLGSGQFDNKIKHP
jgi:hypothetical protein